MARDTWLGKWTRSLTTQASHVGKDKHASLSPETIAKIWQTLSSRYHNNVLLVGSSDLARRFASQVAHQSWHGPIANSLAEIDLRELLTTPSTPSGKEMALRDRIVNCFAEVVGKGHVVLLIESFDELLELETWDTDQKLVDSMIGWMESPNFRCIALTDQPGRDKVNNAPKVARLFRQIELPQLSESEINQSTLLTLEDLEEHHLCAFVNKAVAFAIAASIEFQVGDPMLFITQVLDQAATVACLAEQTTEEQAIKFEHHYQRLLAVRNVALVTGDYLKVISFEEKMKITKDKRMKFGELPKVYAEHVVQVCASKFGMEVDEVRVRLENE